jgi:hypothetical protein
MSKYKNYTGRIIDDPHPSHPKGCLDEGSRFLNKEKKRILEQKINIKNLFLYITQIKTNKQKPQNSNINLPKEFSL